MKLQRVAVALAALKNDPNPGLNFPLQIPRVYPVFQSFYRCFSSPSTRHKSRVQSPEPAAEFVRQGGCRHCRHLLYKSHLPYPSNTPRATHKLGGDTCAADMGFSLYTLFKATLLCTNAIAVLHPKRFLSKHGFDRVDPCAGGASVKNQVVGFLTAVSYLKIPLIIVNFLVILIEIIAG